jgi:nucleotide-binding universal stress UspA family protein
MFKTILVPLDGSKLAEAVLPMVRELALGMSSRVVLLQNVEPLRTRTLAVDALASFDAESIEHGMNAEALNYLEHTAAYLRERGLHVTAERTDEVSTADAIIEAAKRHQVDLIAMATHGRSGISRMLMGSVADHVLHHAPVPVLLERPDRTAYK